MAKRYSPEEKQNVLSFVASFNKKNGRGGNAAAVKKFGVNVNSIRNWQSDPKATSGGKQPSSSQTPKVTKRKYKKRAVAAKGAASPVKEEEKIALLNKMIQIQNQMDMLAKEYQSLKDRV